MPATADRLHLNSVLPTYSFWMLCNPLLSISGSVACICLMNFLAHSSIQPNDRCYHYHHSCSCGWNSSKPRFLESIPGREAQENKLKEGHGNGRSRDEPIQTLTLEFEILQHPSSSQTNLEQPMVHRINKFLATFLSFWIRAYHGKVT